MNDDSEPCLRASSFTLHRGMTGILSLKLALYIVYIDGCANLACGACDTLELSFLLTGAL